MGDISSTNDISLEHEIFFVLIPSPTTPSKRSLPHGPVQEKGPVQKITVILPDSASFII